MHPLVVIAIPLVLLIIGMILNSLRISFDEPATSSEENPAKRLEAEKLAYRRHSNLQRTRELKRQSRVGFYAWLLLIAFVGSHMWMYFDTVERTTAWNKIATLQTIPTEQGQQTVLSVTLLDGSNEKYLIKLSEANSSDKNGKEGVPKETVRSWEMSGLATALSIGNNSLPPGVALTIVN